MNEHTKWSFLGAERISVFSKYAYQKGIVLGIYGTYSKSKARTRMRI